jgi:hypothetical protein
MLDAVQDGRPHLSPEQVQTVQRMFEDMARETQRFGNMILSEERALERKFRKGTINEDDLHAGVARIAALQGELRAVHLRTHLETRSVLSEQQIQHYNRLRGYAPGSTQEHEHEERH